MSGHSGSTFESQKLNAQEGDSEREKYTGGNINMKINTQSEKRYMYMKESKGAKALYRRELHDVQNGLRLVR